MKKHKIARFDELVDRQPAHHLISNTDLVVIRYDEQVSVLYGRCLHRGALMADGFIRGNDLICGLHDWDYRFDTGVSSYDNKEQLHKFQAWIEEGVVYVDEEEVLAWERENPQPYQREEYLGAYQDAHGTAEEPATALIQQLAKHGLRSAHGPSVAMGVPGPELPKWSDTPLASSARWWKKFTAKSLNPAP